MQGCGRFITDVITADQLLCHAIGDYVLQSDWMATEKTKQSIAALCHVLTYGLPFLFLRPSWSAMAVIISTHFVIDRWRLARFVVWAKNWIGGVQRWDEEIKLPEFGLEMIPRYAINLPWSKCQATGYPPSRPVWLAVWLLIIADNIMHVAINGLVLHYL